MIKNFIPLVFVLVALLFIQCNREPLQSKAKVTDLSDFESNDGQISLSILGGKAPYTVQWSNGETDTLIASLAAGTYYLTIIDAKKRVFIDTIEVKQPPYPVCIDAEGNSYKTAIFGNKVWMIENLRVTKTVQGETISSMGDVALSNAEAGLLYTWEEVMAGSKDEGAQGLCPDGWHIPSDKEWFELTDYAKQEGVEVSAVFEPQYAGFYNNGFNSQGISGSYWSSTEANDNAWKRFIHKDLTTVYRYHEKKENAISLRCVRN